MAVIRKRTKWKPQARSKSPKWPPISQATTSANDNRPQHHSQTRMHQIARRRTVLQARTPTVTEAQMVTLTAAQATATPPTAHTTQRRQAQGWGRRAHRTRSHKACTRISNEHTQVAPRCTMLTAPKPARRVSRSARTTTQPKPRFIIQSGVDGC